MAHTANTHGAVNEHLSTEGADDHVDRKTYIMVFIALMVGLVITMAAWMIPFHTFHLGRWNLGPLGIVIAMLIATVKAILVALYFMHLKFASRLTRIFAVSALFWLGLLIALTLNDYVTRAWLPNSESWSEQAQLPPPPGSGAGQQVEHQTKGEGQPSH